MALHSCQAIQDVLDALPSLLFPASKSLPLPQRLFRSMRSINQSSCQKARPTKHNIPASWKSVQIQKSRTALKGGTIVPQSRFRAPSFHLARGRYGLIVRSHDDELKNLSCLDVKIEDGECLPLDHDIAGDFAARAKRFLRFAIQLGFDTPGITERQNKLILTLPSSLFTRSEQCLLRTAAIDLNDDPTQLRRLKVQRQLSFRLPGALE